ncbi:factor H binding protein domain-containing protein [Mannheimia indoligenes]|uniref:factor H binding protein domain-containing protein n=1 Tax=Mannheimia indoligenes TaxID=3103145 RepID=UPI002FE54CE9
MSIKKVTLASLILLSLTACSSGGSGGNSNNATKPNAKPQTTQQQTDKAAAEKAAKEKAEAERLAAEKAAKEKAEAERLAAEKAAKEKAEAERLAAEKAAKEKAEAERLAAEQAAKEKAEAERLAAEKAAKEKAEAERLAIVKAKGIDDENYGIRFNDFKETTEGKIKVRTQSYLYNQPYSVVTAQEVDRTGWDNGKYIDTKDKTITVKGLKTEKLPTEGKATYEGKVFNYHGDTGHSGGFLTYNVDFTNRTGSGRVEGDWGMYILLDKGTIEKNTISSTTQQYYGESHYVNGHYNIEFFGKNAEEIAGKIQTDTDPNGRVESFGLAGTRGDIQ